MQEISVVQKIEIVKYELYFQGIIFQKNLGRDFLAKNTPPVLHSRKISTLFMYFLRKSSFPRNFFEKLYLENTKYKDLTFNI